MGDALAETFQSEFPCDTSVASALAALARNRIPRIVGSMDDTDEDLILRLRDPRVFGIFVEGLQTQRRLPSAARIALAEHVFDLLPLPRTEGEVIAVESRAPPRLLALAASLAESPGLSVLQLMHLVYAVFLDRSLLVNVPARIRSIVLCVILAQSETSEGLRLFYAGLHLSSIPEREAILELERTLDTATLPVGLRCSLAALATSEDGGRSALTRIAQKEGILPSSYDDSQAPNVLANVPRLPDRLQEAGRRFLERQR